jgi:PAS domain S-box-containing protein/putative nucleotidyltransferase with HDIG domain
LAKEHTMKDQDKTQKQLIKEVTRLRQRVAELEASEHQRKELEEVLKRSDQEKTAILGSMSELVAYQDTRMRILWANRAAGESVGVDPQQLVGRHCYEIWPQRRKPCVGCPVVKARKSGNPQEAEITTSDGRVWLIKGYPVRDQKGNIRGAVEVTLEITDYKRAEETLRTEQDKAQQYLNIAEAMLIVLDKKGTITLINRKGSQILGYKEGELIGKNWFATCLPSHLRKYVKNVFKKLMAGEGKQTEFYENPVLTKSGTERIIAWHNTILKDTQGTIIGTLSSGEDITERKQVENELRKFKEISDKASYGITIVDLEGNVSYVNTSFAKMHGYTPNELIGKHLSIFHTEKQMANVKGLIEQLNREGNYVAEEVWHKRKDNSEFPTLMTGTLIKDANGTPLFMAGTAIDITEHKRAEEALRESETRFRTLFEGIPDSILVHDDEGKILHVNEIGAQRLEWSPKDLVGRNLREIVTPENAVSIADHIRETHKVGWCRFETTYVSRSGWQIMAEVNERAIKFGEVKAILSVAHDITERKQVEEALRTSEAQLSNAMEIAKLGYWEYDVAEDIFTFNDHFYEIFRTTAEKVGGYKMSSEQYAKQFIHPDDISVVGIEIRKAIETTDQNFSRQLDHRIIYADGEIGYIAVRFFIVKDSHGRTVKTYGANQDITERKKAEEALKQSEASYHDLFNLISDAVYVIDQESGRVLDVNEAACKMYGYTREEWLKMKNTDVSTEPAETQKATKKTPEAIPIRYHKKKDGSVFPLEMTLNTFDLKGRKTIIATARDITERKQMEEELRQTEERFRRVVETMKVGLGAIDENGVLTYVNEYLAKMLGYSMDEMIGRSTLDFYFDEESSKAQKEIFAKRMTGMQDSTPYEVTWRKKDGEKVYSILSPTPHFDADGRYTGSFAIHTDITGRKQTEEALQRSYEQLRETLMTTVSALTSMVEMKDRYTAGHQPRVAQLACAIAEEMKQSREQIEGIRIAGLLHDIGKIMIPAEILSKPGPLTDIQYDMVKMHPQAGYDIVKGIKFPWPVAQIVLQHHERMDGSGYPQGLSGEEIILEARILGVANVVEAMTAHRPHRAAHDIKEALREISQHKGVFYDPDVVNACLKLFTKKQFTFS